MKTLILNICILLVILTSSNSIIAQGRVNTCDFKKTVAPKDLRDKVIRYAGYVKKASDDQISPDIKRKLKVQYDEIQEAFNGIYDEMKKDRTNLSSKSKICNRYGERLKIQVQKSEEFISNIDKQLKFRQAGFGVDDLIALVTLIVEKRTGSVEKFFNDLKWPEWENIKERSF